MQPFEIMISESQERMAAIVEPARLAEVEAVCARWELPVHGDRPRHRRRPPALPLRRRGRRRHAGRGARGRAALPAARRAPDSLADARWRPPTSRRSTDPAALLLACSPRPNVCSKAWVYAQYDQLVGSGTVMRPGGDAACAADAVGARRSRSRSTATARASRSIRAAAAPRPSRRRPQRRMQRRRARRDHELPQLRQPRAAGHGLRAARGHHGHGGGLRGVRHAGRLRQRLALQRERGRPIHPTPVVGCVGVLERAERRCGRRRADGERVAFVSARPTPAYDGSEWQALVGGAAAGRIPESTCPRCAGSATCSSSSRATACSALRTTSPTAASRSHWPRWRSPPERAPGGPRSRRGRRGDALR